MTKNSKPKFADFLYNQGDRILLLKKILLAFNSPDKKFKIIHICGTNGKGSTSYMIASILQQMGFKTGLFTSPAIGTDTNSIQVNFNEIKNQIFKNYLDKIEAQMKTKEFINDQLSQFEALFLAAMLYFSDQKVDFVVLECGLGGELDATNAVFNTMYSIFTEVGMDHIGILGNNIYEIATTKSKIIRKNNTTIISKNEPKQAFQVIKKEALLKNSAFLSAQEVLINKSLINGNSAIEYKINGKNISGTFGFGLRGQYQLSNLATVLRWFFNFIRNYRVNQPDKILNAALENLKVPGRFETVSQNPTIILDGGHNPDGIRAFFDSVNEIYENTPKIIVNGFLKDKDYQQAVDTLVQLKNTRFIVTEPQNPVRELHANSLANVYKRKINKDIPYFDDPTQAVLFAINLANKDKARPVIFVVGSFYLVNPVRKYLVSDD